MNKQQRISWRAPSNIALVKYWGKRPVQLPANPSISMTLAKSYTETSLGFQQHHGKSEHKFLFEGKPNPMFEAKITRYLENVTAIYPELKPFNFTIESKNTFPHSAGIASSASAMSSLALCLCSLLEKIKPGVFQGNTFFQNASKLARLGSGSAARSVYGGWNLWGELGTIKGSSMEYAVPLNDMVNERFRFMHDSVLIVDTGKKAISSSEGHQLMDTNPYRDTRVKTAKTNTIKMINALYSGSKTIFRDVVENEMADLHAMFLTSHPHFVLVKPETLAVIEKIKKYRADTGFYLTFTLDAGPNVHLLYPGEVREPVKAFIEKELLPLCENGSWIDDHTGNGPERSSE